MDQNGSVHEFEYDRLGRQIVDKATTLGTDVDDVVRRVEREYGVHGMLERTANYDATTAGSVVNDVEFTYNGFGQLTVDSQEHDGEVDGNTLDVQYAHVAGASNLYRRALTTYPNGRVLYYYYGGICDYISRPYYVRDFPTANDTCHGVYYYQGLDEIIRHSVNLSGAVTLDREYDNGSGGYSDRFGRLTNLYWYGWVSQACVAQVKHDYDRVSNRLCREDVLAKSQGTPVYIDELYTYDGMHQLTAQQRGELNVAHDGLVANSKTFAEQWTLDPTGNWSEFKQDTDGDGDWDLDQDRDHTVANEVLEIDDATTHVAHDRAGNMTRIPKPSDWSSHYHLVYDAWNRLVCVYDSDGETPISAYYYDGLGRRVIKDVYDEGSLASRRHYYYSDTWQVLEERLETSDGSGGFDTAIVDRQYVWGLRYVDDLLSRDRNTDGTSTGDYGKTGSGLDERVMVLQDANYNVCAIANTTGVCLERYNYTSYGEPNCLTPAFADRASTDYDWDILYTGRQYDSETGLYQYRNRYYHPQLGRFVNRDLIGYEAEDMNLYLYVDNGPLVFTNPMGLKVQCQYDEEGAWYDPNTGEWYDPVEGPHYFLGRPYIPTPPPTPIPENECCQRAFDLCLDVFDPADRDACIKGRRSGKGSMQGDWGGVICCNGKLKACNWKGNRNWDPGNNIRNPIANEVVENCILAHEGAHIPATIIDCGVGEVTRPGTKWFPPSGTSECAAYQAQLDCLNDGITGKCCGNEDCITQLAYWTWWVRERRDEACANGE